MQVSHRKLREYGDRRRADSEFASPLRGSELGFHAASRREPSPFNRLDSDSRTSSVRTPCPRNTLVQADMHTMRCICTQQLQP